MQQKLHKLEASHQIERQVLNSTMDDLNSQLSTLQVEKKKLAEMNKELRVKLETVPASLEFEIQTLKRYSIIQSFK